MFEVLSAHLFAVFPLKVRKNETRLFLIAGRVIEKEWKLGMEVTFESSCRTKPKPK